MNVPSVVKAALPCLLLCLAVLGCAGGSGAACAVGLSPEPSRAAPGDAFRLRGEGFGTGCNDHPFGSSGRPQRNIRIGMRQGDKTWDLATVDADRRHSFDAKLRVPVSAEPGRAVVVVRDGGAPPWKLPFRVLGGGSG